MDGRIIYNDLLNTHIEYFETCMLMIRKKVLIVLMAPEIIMSPMMVNLKVVVTPAIIDIFNS